jgi:hypothetical protein
VARFNFDLLNSFLITFSNGCNTGNALPANRVKRNCITITFQNSFQIRTVISINQFKNGFPHIFRLRGGWSIATNYEE